MSSATTHSSTSAQAKARGKNLVRLVLEEGGPGFCQFAINNACNANCGFCGFARDTFPRDQWKFVEREEAFRSIDILYDNGVRFLVISGGEPTLHPDHVEICGHAVALGMKVMLVTNAGLLKEKKIRALADVGLSSLIISVDAATVEAHEKNRGLPGVCDKIREGNRVLRELGLHATASVTMSRLVDYDTLPGFLEELGFSSVTFSYPLDHLNSNFLGFSESDLVKYGADELDMAFEKVKAMKKRFRVVNPTASIEEMQRFIKGDEQRFPCLGGFQYFYLDWNLDLWRCHYWEEPMCKIWDFDGSQRVRDGCTRCMIDCYRDSSVMQQIGTSAHDAYQAMRGGHPVAAARALTRRANLDSIRSLLEELPWLLRF